MKTRGKLYAFIMVAVYVAATVLSSVSLLLCDEHHHHHYHAEETSCACHSTQCNHGGATLSSDCCDHHHPILGDNHTDYIASSHRSDDARASQALALMLAPAVAGILAGEIAMPEADPLGAIYGDKVVPLKAAEASTAALRAPPVLA